MAYSLQTIIDRFRSLGVGAAVTAHDLAYALEHVMLALTTRNEPDTVVEAVPEAETSAAGTAESSDPLVELDPPATEIPPPPPPDLMS